MKYSAFFTLFLIFHTVSEAAESSNLLCELFDVNTSTLVRFCKAYTKNVPDNCRNEDSTSEVKALILRGCDKDYVLNNTKLLSNVSVVDISYSGYVSLNWFDAKLDQLNKFNASYNEISSINVPFLSNAFDVSEIDLSHNVLTHIDENAFAKLGKLVKINLSHNDLYIIHYDTFRNSLHLEFIDFGSNYFNQVPVFPGNKETLKAIDLTKNPITDYDCFHIKTMPSTAVYLTWKNLTIFLGEMYCAQRKLDIIPNSPYEGVISRVNGSYELHCHENSFKELQHFVAGINSFANVTNVLHCFGQLVREIDFSGNIIGTLNTSTFQKLNNLTKLSLSNTSLSEFDLSIIQHLKHLWALDLSNNNLKYVDDYNVSIKNFTSDTFNATEYQNVTDLMDLWKLLKVFNVSKTNLSVVDSNLFQLLHKPYVLDISFNHMENVNITVFSTSLKYLGVFYAIDCQIKNAAEILQYLGAPLVDLDLSGNRIETLNSQTFQTFNNLKYLKLSNAQILRFDANTFQCQTKLEVLDISRNKLQVADLGCVSNTLKRLYLQRNDLKRIENFSPSRFQQLEYVAVGRNQLPCPFLKQLDNELGSSKLIGDGWSQQPDVDCRTGSQGVTDFLGSIYDKVKIW